MRRVFTSLVSFLVYVSLATLAFGQATDGNLVGTVTDPHHRGRGQQRQDRHWPAGLRAHRGHRGIHTVAESVRSGIWSLFGGAVQHHRQERDE